MPNTSYLPVDEKLRLDLINKIRSNIVLVRVYLGKKLIESNTLEMKDSTVIYIPYKESGNPRLSNLPEAECHFSINQDMYFFKGVPTYIDEKLAFNLPTIVYKIQRRENFRVFVPPSVLQNIELVTERSSKAVLNNLSLTGGKITVKSPDLNLALDRFKLNNPIKLKITLLDFNNQIFNCVIKYVEASPKTGTTILGIQFQNLDAVKTQELQNVIAKIDRLNRQVAA